MNTLKQQANNTKRVLRFILDDLNSSLDYETRLIIEEELTQINLAQLKERLIEEGLST